ncbi:DUF2878 domain-containing protein [Vibrio ziniensis]|uniref:DUF2878 domain-containing protein n=1 Tax=Vibrio ziniensis TaxID=2711221 RepID=A0A6G7CJ77_9VIBR|nr:DUF2878 domain-containing protein [Vibrio ziniensis]QIH42134.1 DUF2878 domain-containing protein [Vibrio ziniensis]
MNRLFVVSLWFQLIWFLAVLGQESWQWLTLGFGVVTLCYAAYSRQEDIGKILLLGIGGVALDSFNSAVGLLVFKSAHVPLWLAVLWFVFVWYAREWVPKLAQYPKVWVMFLVGLGGALSYWAGYRFSAVEFSLPLAGALLFIALQWCGVTWLIMRMFTNDYSTSNNASDVSTPDANSTRQR